MADPVVHVVFDLDDTLYAEVTYVKSAFAFFGQLVAEAYGVENGTARLWQLFKTGIPSPIQTYWSECDFPAAALADCIAAMRAHRPCIALHEGARELIANLQGRGIIWSILTDGRSLTQRQKINALLLGEIAGAIYISEERAVGKPDVGAYLQIERDFPEAKRYLYVGDNPAKDFVAANGLGWMTVMLRDSGENLHTQPAGLPKIMQAQVFVDTLTQVLDVLEKR